MVYYVGKAKFKKRTYAVRFKNRVNRMNRKYNSGRTDFKVTKRPVSRWYRVK